MTTRKRLAWPRMTGRWYTTAQGNTAHIQAVPHLTDEDRAMLDKLIDAAMAHYDKRRGGATDESHRGSRRIQSCKAGRIGILAIS